MGISSRFYNEFFHEVSPPEGAEMMSSWANSVRTFCVATLVDAKSLNLSDKQFEMFHGDFQKVLGIRPNRRGVVYSETTSS